MKNKILIYWLIFNVFIIFSIGVIINKTIEINQLKKENNNIKTHIRKDLMNDLQKQQLKISELQNEYAEIKQKRFITQNDIKSLEKIVEVEAADEGIRGKALVACVVLNRWSNDSNKTVNDIITIPGQFSPVAMGRYYTSIPTDETKTAVNMALYKDYSHGSLYFMNPKIADRNSIRWFNRSLTFTTKYKHHNFYK